MVALLRDSISKTTVLPSVINNLHMQAMVHLLVRISRLLTRGCSSQCTATRTHHKARLRVPHLDNMVGPQDLQGASREDHNLMADHINSTPLNNHLMAVEVVMVTRLIYIKFFHCAYLR